MTPFVRFVAAAGVLASALAAVAAPTPVVPLLPISAGLATRWVGVDPLNDPNSLADALSVLSGGVPQVAFADPVVLTVDLGDGAAMVDPMTALGSDSFAVRYTGYLFIEARGDYQFGMFHDDGIQVILGGENIIEFASDTSPTLTTSAIYTLDAGYYTLQIVGWDQGDTFVNRFGTINPNGAIDIADALWHSSGRTTVAEPAIPALVGIALLTLGLRRRRG